MEFGSCDFLGVASEAALDTDLGTVVVLGLGTGLEDSFDFAPYFAGTVGFVFDTRLNYLPLAFESLGFEGCRLVGNFDHYHFQP